MKKLNKIFFMTIFIICALSVKAYGAKATVPALAGSTEEYIPLQNTITVTETEFTLVKRTVLPYENIPLDIELVDYIYNRTKEGDLPFHIFIALIDLETGETFNPNLISDTNDHGLCQINKRYFEYHCETAGVDYNTFDPYNPYHSVDVSIGVLNSLIERYKSDYIGTELIEYILSCYNRGETGVKNYIKSNGTFSTPYSRIIIDRSEKYKLEEVYEYQ
ncbi:MAG: transglycosylase SLT domain-containing protein [Candidatus Izemoplasmatales bacterium]|nr:transglycosylase SLT domain-containing protein [Candidatus Izemoplasmatales bacterium]